MPASSATTRRGPYAKTVEVRAAILEAAVTVFSRSGFRSGSVREVAERAGMSEAGVLHHFPSKVELMLEVLKQRDAWQDRRFDELRESPAAELNEMLRIASSNMSEPGAVALYAVLSAEATAPEHPAHDFFVRRYRRGRAFLTEVFAALAQDGLLLVDEHPASLAQRLIALMDGLQVQWLLEPDAVDMGADLRSILEGIVHPSVFEATPPPVSTSPGRASRDG